MGNDATDDDVPKIRKRCEGCSLSSPRVEGEFALIRAGWRLTRAEDEADRKAMIWWCPACFERRRARATE